MNTQGIIVIVLLVILISIIVYGYVSGRMKSAPKTVGDIASALQKASKEKNIVEDVILAISKGKVVEPFEETAHMGPNLSRDIGLQEETIKASNFLQLETVINPIISKNKPYGSTSCTETPTTLLDRYRNMLLNIAIVLETIGTPLITNENLDNIKALSVSMLYNLIIANMNMTANMTSSGIKSVTLQPSGAVKEFLRSSILLTALPVGMPSNMPSYILDMMSVSKADSVNFLVNTGIVTMNEYDIIASNMSMRDTIQQKIDQYLSNRPITIPYTMFVNFATLFVYAILKEPGFRTNICLYVPVR